MGGAPLSRFLSPTGRRARLSSCFLVTPDEVEVGVAPNIVALPLSTLMLLR